ncbi:MAG: bifunctional homocysteine S-methyltransferase/methylenetetrahydrofolate reductase [Clostridia bacterium]
MKKHTKNNILLFDGAMGTYFSSIHSDPLYKCELANITSPNTIKEIHNRYLKAGANAIKTNTFSLSDCEKFSYIEIIKSGYHLAFDCAKEHDAMVFCDISTPYSPNQGDILQQYKNIADIFIELGGKNFIFETLSQVEYANETAKYIKSKVIDAYIIVSFTVNADGFTKTGEFGENLLKNTNEFIDAVGFNCVCGPLHMLNHIKNLNFREKPISIMPNASYPTIVGNRALFSSNPSYFAKQMMEIISEGATIVGGCCGTTPEFIAEISKEISQISLDNSLKPQISAQNIVKSIEKSDFYEKLKSGKKPIAVELDPPANVHIEDFLSGAKTLKDVGVDMITIADCPVARARMDSSLLACKLKRELKIDVMPHMTCRDRNINASKALLLGLNMEKITDVLIVTGDPVPSEQRDEVKAVYEFNSRMMLNHVNQLNESLFSSPFYLYAALNINARNFSVQLRLAKQKVTNGAIGFFTQPVLSEQALENLKIAKKELNVPIIGGILPIVSHRNACFINNEIPGITVCDEIVDLYENKERDECSKLAVKISTEIAKKMSDIIDGYYLITPFKRVDIIQEIVQNISEF